jgi:hypothetical protein
MFSHPHNAGRKIACTARRIADRVRAMSSRGLRLLIAGLCKLALVLVLIDPAADGLFGKTAEATSHHASQELIREQEATSVAPRGFIARLGDMQTAAAARAREGRLAGNVLSRTSAHVLANGLRAPLTG